MLSKREMEIIQFLMDKDDYINGETISTFMGISSKTLRSDIKNINQQLIEINSKICGVRGKGYILESDNKENLYRKLLELYESDTNIVQFIPTTLEGRVNYIIKKLLSLELKKDKGITHKKLCDSLFIGLTTLKNDLNIVKKRLQRFNIEVIKYGAKGIALQGKEDDLRSCIKYFIFQKPENDIIDLDSITPIFKKKQIDMVKSILTSIINKNGIPMTDIGFYNLLVHILIVIKRIQNNNKIEVIESAETLKNTKEYITSLEISKEISKTIDVELPMQEVYFITQHLYTQKNIIGDIEKKELDIENKYSALVKDILDNLRDTIDIDFTNDELLIWGLATHLKSAINRVKFGMHITNDMLYEIKRNYSFPYNIAVLAANFIERRIGKPINEDEIGFICLHFAAAFQRLKDTKDNKKLRVLIICASGLGTSIILSTRIKKEFGNMVEIIKVIPLNKLNSVPTDEYDAIISTIKIDESNNKLRNKKIIYISPIFKTEDIKIISNFIDTNKETSILRFLEYTEEDLFFVDTKFETKEDIINFITNKMVKKGYLKEGDKESFFKRENVSSTEIGNLIAIPHAIDIAPEISKVCILINKKTILWDEEQVKLVILMSIEKEQYLEFGQILEELYLRLDNKEKVIKLINARDYAEFIKLLR